MLCSNWNKVVAEYPDGEYTSILDANSFSYEPNVLLSASGKLVCRLHFSRARNGALATTKKPTSFARV